MSEQSERRERRGKRERVRHRGGRERDRVRKENFVTPGYTS